MTPRRVFIFLAFAFWGPFVRAQGIPGAIVGRVTMQGKPLVRARVVIDSGVLQNTRVTTTTTRGTYWAGVLPPGVYNVTFSHAGAQTVTRKTVLRLGETVRLDADVDPSDEGEQVTLTTVTRSIFERPQIETSVESGEINDLPIVRDLPSRASLAPGVFAGAIRRSPSNMFIVDGVEQGHRGANVEVEEAIQDATVVTSPISPEYGRFSGGVIAASTRTGGNALDGSIRDTITSERWTVGTAPHEGSELHSRGEAALGGGIIRDALWFFLAGETGSSSFDRPERSGLVKLTGSPDSHDTVVVSALRASAPDESRGSAEYTSVPTKNSVFDARIDTSRVGDSREHHSTVAAHVFLPAHVGGEHALTAGADRFGGSNAFFANDDWTDGRRWIVSAGVRYDEDIGASPRAGVVYDLGGDGRARLAATYARFAATRSDSTRETTFAYGQRVFTNGFGRAALVRRVYESGQSYRGLEAELRMVYLLFTVGGTATVAHGMNGGAVWISATPPALEQHVNASVLERVRQSDAATDMSLQYRFGRFFVEPFVKIDVLNLFNHTMPLRAGEDPVGAHRAVRIGVGARL
jgi:hypothetical protein